MFRRSRTKRFTSRALKKNSSAKKSAFTPGKKNLSATSRLNLSAIKARTKAPTPPIIIPIPLKNSILASQVVKKVTIPTPSPPPAISPPRPVNPPIVRQIPNPFVRNKKTKSKNIPRPTPTIKVPTIKFLPNKVDKGFEEIAEPPTFRPTPPKIKTGPGKPKTLAQTLNLNKVRNIRPGGGRVPQLELDPDFDPTGDVVLSPVDRLRTNNLRTGGVRNTGGVRQPPRVGNPLFNTSLATLPTGPTIDDEGPRRVLPIRTPVRTTPVRTTPIRTTPQPPVQTVIRNIPAPQGNVSFSITSIPSGAEVLVNGKKQNIAVTPTQLFFGAKELLGTTKTITVRRTGYNSSIYYTIQGKEKVEVSVETIGGSLPQEFDDDGRFRDAFGDRFRDFTNADDSRIPIGDSIDRIRRTPVKKIEKRTKKYLYSIVKYENGKRVGNVASESSSRFFKLDFDLKKNRIVNPPIPDPIPIPEPDEVIIDIPEPPAPEPTPSDPFPDPPKPTPPRPPAPELLILNGKENDIRGKYVATITKKQSNVARVGGETFKASQPFEILIRAKSPSTYMIKEFRVLKGTTDPNPNSVFETVPANEITLAVNGPMVMYIEFEKVVPILTPSVRLSGTSFKYNIGNPQKINLGYDATNADKVTFKLNKTTIDRTADSGVFQISNTMFAAGVGQYTGYVVPSNGSYGDGTPQRFSINVVNEVQVSTPDIININYPALLKGADFAGYDVPFSIQYQSVNTNFVRIYLGSKKVPYGRFAPNQSVDFNVQTLIKKLNGNYKEEEDEIVFNILLQPHNTSTSKEVVGKLESVEVRFVKSDLELPRGTTIDQLCDAFDFDTNLFDDETSKYLTHLAHFGDGDNKLISNWETDDQTFAEYSTNNLLQLPDPNSKTGGFDALVLKMYEPLPRSVEPNQELWISKIITRPIIEEVSIIDDSEEYCVPLKGPNFGINECGSPADTGFEIIDELVASGSQSSAKLIDTFVSSSGIDTKKLDIEYVSASYDYIETEDGYTVDGTITENYKFENFSHFGSATERAKNFWYKVSLLETYNNSISTIESGSGSSTGSLSLIREKESIQKKINDVKANFDGFEHFLYESTSSLAYPKESDGITLESTGSGNSVAWYNTIIISASAYDSNNVDYLANNIPTYIKNDDEQTDFILFLDMMGHHFDILWTYIKALKRNTKVEEKQRVGISDDMLKHILKNYSWIPHSSQSTSKLWEYVLGYRDSKQTQKLAISGKEYENTIWRRILNNLPYLLKHKGTRRGLSAVLTTYGIPSSLMTIMEFGGPRQESSQISTFTFDDRTSAVVMPNDTDDSKILVDWKLDNEVSSSKAVEVRFKTNNQHTQSLLTNEPYWNVTLEHQHGNIGRLNFSSSFGEVITESGSLFNDEYTQFVINVNHNSAGHGGSNETIELVAMQDFQSRIRMTLSSSVEFTSSINEFFSGSQLAFGDGFTGSLDEIRIWNSSLSSSVIQDHTLYPEKVSGNHISSSTEDLMLRLDFEKPKNLNTNTVIPNIAPDTGSNGLIRYASAATASGFSSNTEYPYQYEVYDRTVTAKVPAMGFGPADKFRFESASLVQNLSYRQRATKKSYDTAPLDTNQLGIFLSPSKEVNMDIIKSLPDFMIDDYIGEPGHQYLDSYPDLVNLKEYMFGRYNLNIYEYINIIKYIDKSLFETIRQMIPARVKVLDGLLIEPHLLNRNKIERKKPTGEVMESKEGVENVSRASVIKINSTANQTETLLDLSNVIDFEPTIPQFDTDISESTQPNIDFEYNDLNAIFDDTEVTELTGRRLDYETLIEAPNEQTLQSELETLSSQIIGFDGDGLGNGYGLYANNGFTVRTVRDKFNNFKKEKVRVWVVKKEKTFKEKVQLHPLDSSLGTIVSESAPITKTIITFTSPSGSLTGSLQTTDIDGTVIQVSPLDGYLPTHHKNSDKSTGMENLFFRGCKQTQATTLDGTPPVEVFTTNPNTLKISDSGRGSGEPILEIE